GGAAARHRLGEDAAAAAHVDHLLARQPREAVDPVQAQRVDVVQRLEFARRVPPAMRELAEFVELGLVGVHAAHSPKKNPAEAGCFFKPESWCYLDAGELVAG